VVAVVVAIVGITIALRAVPWSNIKAVLCKPDTLPKQVALWVLGSLLCFVVANGVFYVVVSMVPQRAPNAAMVFSVFWAVAVGILILLLTFSLDGIKPALGVLAGIAGGIIGWLLGMYISPEGTTEQQQFAKIGTALVALFSGYTLKVVIDWLKDDKNKEYRLYCVLLVLSASVSTAAVYNTRAYGNIEVRISFPDTLADPKDKHKIAVVTPADIPLVASVTGVPDTSVTWQILPHVGSDASSGGDASLTNGHFTASAPDIYRVLARSNYDPRLADTVEIAVNKK
jgi:hypothetical protein